MRRSYDPGAKWLPDTDLVGPGYASAYGLVMLVHHRTYRRGGVTIWEDNGVRTHGSVSYQSILRGESHGCHRLFNPSAVQLGSFLLRHRAHVRHGLIDKPFVRLVPWRFRTLKLPIPHRGYRFELIPPVPVLVLEGNIRGTFRRPPARFIGVSP